MLKISVLESLKKSVNSSFDFAKSEVSRSDRSGVYKSGAYGAVKPRIFGAGKSSPYSPMASRYLCSQGIVLEPLTSGTVGRIKLDGVLWKARLSESSMTPLLPRGARVSILYRDGLTLVVEPSIAFSP